MKTVKLGLLSILMGMSSITIIVAQTLSSKIPENPDVDGYYMFYLHGGIVQEQGANAVSSRFGKYEYHGILDTLIGHGFYVISEVRPRHTEEKAYALQLYNQIRTLRKLGVPAKNIIVVGASLGAYIALEISILNSDPQIRFVLIGLCSDHVVSNYAPVKNKFTGQMLSIYESSDSKGTCHPLFKDLKGPNTFKEIQLDMGIDHGFLYRPYDDWVFPLVNWVKQ